MGIFYQEKAFHTRKKIRENDFAPSEKYTCYAPEWPLGAIIVKTLSFPLSLEHV